MEVFHPAGTYLSTSTCNKKYHEYINTLLWDLICNPLSSEYDAHCCECSFVLFKSFSICFSVLRQCILPLYVESEPDKARRLLEENIQRVCVEKERMRSARHTGRERNGEFYSKLADSIRAPDYLLLALWMNSKPQYFPSAFILPLVGRLPVSGNRLPRRK